MKIFAGAFLSSLPSLDETNFEQSIILITEYNGKGAMGFVINKPFPRRLNELAEFSRLPSFPLYEGGPVDQEHLYFIHRRPDVITGGTHVSEGIYFGGDFKQATQGISSRIITENDIKIFVGYCGWDYRQLEEEVQEGSWQVEDDERDAFSL